jgi:hypothetical protein
VDTDTKNFDIVIGTPSVAALIKKELGLQKGSSEAGKLRVGDLSEDQVKKIARVKFGSDELSFINQIKGTAKSMGITIGQGAVTEEELKAEKAEKERLKEEAKKEAEAPTKEKPETETEKTTETKEINTQK